MRSLAAFALALILLLSPAGAPAAELAPAALQLPVVRYQLANGLEVLLLEDHRLPQVYVNVTYHVGSGDEERGKSGLAHLFEHMMFQGSRHVGPDQHFAILRRIGGRGTNGTTNTDRTNYFETVPAHQLETALWLESDRMGYLGVTQAVLDNQREVVKNERRENYENLAYSGEVFAVARALYPEGHPYRHLTIGLPDELNAASLDDVRAFFNRWYAPANATLLIAGDFAPDRARALVDRWFGTFPAAPRPTRRTPAAPVLGQKVRQTIRDPLATRRRVRFVFPSPAIYAPGDAELDLLGIALSSNTGRLRRALMVTRPLATAVSAFQLSRRGTSEFHVVVDLQPGADQGLVEREVNGELFVLAELPLEDRELAQVRAQFQINIVRSLERLASRGERIQLYANHGRELTSAAWDLDRYRRATAADLHATARKIFTDRRVEIVTLPGGP